jgi:hypothetical protein
MDCDDEVFEEEDVKVDILSFLYVLVRRKVFEPEAKERVVLVGLHLLLRVSLPAKTFTIQNQLVQLTTEIQTLRYLDFDMENA